MSAVQKSARPVWGEHFRRPLANQVGKLADLVSGLKRLSQRQGASRLIAADVQASAYLKRRARHG